MLAEINVLRQVFCVVLLFLILITAALSPFDHFTVNSQEKRIVCWFDCR